MVVLMVRELVHNRLFFTELTKLIKAILSDRQVISTIHVAKSRISWYDIRYSTKNHIL